MTVERWFRWIHLYTLWTRQGRLIGQKRTGGIDTRIGDEIIVHTMRFYDQWKFAMIRISCWPCAFMETAGLSCTQLNINYYHVFGWVARGIREDGLSENVRLYIIIAYTYLGTGTAHSRPDPCSRGSLTDGNRFRRNIEKVTYRWWQIAGNVMYRISG